MTTGNRWGTGKGYYIDKGYRYITCPSIERHRHLCLPNGYIAEHRLMYEIYHNCCLLKWSDVHHINGDKLNNTESNLMAMLKGHHTTMNLIGNTINTGRKRSEEYKRQQSLRVKKIWEKRRHA